TKRVTVPEQSELRWIDTINLTRNEWVAAEQHKEYYSIYRVYFVPGKVIIFVIANPYLKNKDGILKAIPLNYRVDFGSDSIDNIIKPEH
ncbi:MAG: protein NO VEIN domain-containing protein, partial [Mobilitalea sp.]